MSEIIHASAVLYRGLGLVIRGASGAGKSTLAARLIADGAVLVGDDRLHISACGGRIVASGPAAIAGQLELRCHGIAALPTERAVVVGLVVDLMAEDEIERFPGAEVLEATLLGVRLPRQPVPEQSNRDKLLVDAAVASILAEKLA